MESNTKKNWLIGCLIGFLLIAAIVLWMGFYMLYFQFNQQDVKDYINEEVNTYPEDKRAAVYKIIKDGVEYILSERNLTQQVIKSAKATGIPREQELVHAAIMQAKNYGYID